MGSTCANHAERNTGTLGTSRSTPGGFNPNQNPNGRGNDHEQLRIYTFLYPGEKVIFPDGEVREVTFVHHKNKPYYYLSDPQLKETADSDDLWG